MHTRERERERERKREGEREGTMERRNSLLREKRDKWSSGMEVFWVCMRNFHAHSRERDSGEKGRDSDKRREVLSSLSLSLSCQNRCEREKRAYPGWKIYVALGQKRERVRMKRLRVEEEEEDEDENDIEGGGDGGRLRWWRGM